MITDGLPRLPFDDPNGSPLAVITSYSGALGLYTVPLTDAGMVGLVFSNGPAVMPPWGGDTPVLSTSPIAAGIPLGDRTAIVDLVIRSWDPTLRVGFVQVPQSDAKPRRNCSTLSSATWVVLKQEIQADS